MKPYITIIPQTGLDLDITKRESVPAFALIESTSPEGKASFKDFDLIVNLTASEISQSTAFDGWMAQNNNNT